MTKKVLLFRDFQGFTGGHLKVWHYHQHLLRHPAFDPVIHFSRQSLWVDSNPWLGMRDEVLEDLDGFQPDILFLAGMDWLMAEPILARFPEIPVINLIQHVRHANPTLPLYGFLKNKATRICVSEEVKEAILATGQVAGDVHAIPNGLDMGELDAVARVDERDIDLLIAGNKHPVFARKVYENCRGRGLKLVLLDSKLLRHEFLSYLARAKTTLFLPKKTEGFYLPALEGMALGSLVICPDCIGNRSFCLPDANAFRPAYGMEAILHAIDRAIDLAADTRAGMLAEARRTAAAHTLIGERERFYSVLDQLAEDRVI